MKLMFIRTHTPLLDISAVFLVVAIYLGGLSEFIATKLFGISWTAKGVDSGTMFLFVSVILLSAFMFIAATLFLFRYIVSKFFRHNVGDEYIELDAATNVVTVVEKKINPDLNSSKSKLNK